MAAKDQLGRAGEERAATHLEKLGYTIVDRNWRCPVGEIDLVATVGDELVVIEVKARTSEAFGHPLAAVDTVKRGRIWRVAMAWIASHPEITPGRRLRFAAIAIIGPDPSTGRVEMLHDLEIR